MGGDTLNKDVLSASSLTRVVHPPVPLTAGFTSTGFTPAGFTPAGFTPLASEDAASLSLAVCGAGPGDRGEDT
jgi:hypothetical protein